MHTHILTYECINVYFVYIHCIRHLLQTNGTGYTFTCIRDTCACMHTHARTHIHTQAHACTAFAEICACRHTNTHAHTHTHTHTHTRSRMHSICRNHGTIQAHTCIPTDIHTTHKHSIFISYHSFQFSLASPLLFLCFHPVPFCSHTERLELKLKLRLRLVLLQTVDAVVGECPNVPGRMECVPVGCNATLINDTFGVTGWASFDSGVVSDMAPIGANATVKCNTGYYLREEGDAGGLTTCSNTCLISLTTCLPVECVGGATIPVTDSIVVDSPAKFMFPNRCDSL
jgi:hypothetical protein